MQKRKNIHSDLIDLVDENDNPTGKTATWEEVTQNGYWHRGVHIIIYTPDKKILMQKRSKKLEYHPGEIEISVGGGVIAGEDPADAIIREAKEETGIMIDPSTLKYIGKMKFNRRYKFGGERLYMRGHIYSYKALVPDVDINMVGTDSEATQIFWLTKRQVKRAINRRYVKGFGKMSSLYAYWKSLVKSIE